MSENIVCPKCHKETNRYAPACTHCFGALNKETIAPAAHPPLQTVFDTSPRQSLPKAEPEKKKSQKILWVAVGLTFLVTTSIAAVLLLRDKPAEQARAVQSQSEDSESAFEAKTESKAVHKPDRGPKSMPSSRSNPKPAASTTTLPAPPVAAKKASDISIETNAEQNVRTGEPFLVEVTIKGNFQSIEKPLFVPSSAGSGDVKMLSMDSYDNAVGGRGRVFEVKLVTQSAGRIDVGVVQFAIDGVTYKTPKIQVDSR